ncbi:MAG: hypothetical protein IH897_07920 [Planctomycetes bacterium]|nr:hypothetical protein [Planctomycetota bacterium]
MTELTDFDTTRHSRRGRFRSLIPYGRARTASLVLALASLAPVAANGEDPADLNEPIPGVSPEVTVTDRGRIEMHVADLPLSTALQLLSIRSQRNIIASPNVQGSVTANLYDATFHEALTAILIANDAAYQEVGNFIYVYTRDEMARIEAAKADKDVTRVFALNYISAADARSYIEPLVGEGGTIAVSPAPDTGLKSSPEEAGGNAYASGDFIVVTAAPATLREIERVLRDVDVRPRQVLVEATIIRAELKDENALGIDFTIVGGVDLELLGATSNGIKDLSLGPLPQARFEDSNAIAATDFAGDVPAGGITVGIIQDHVAVFLRALEQITDTTVLANPKILALNKQKAQIIVGRRDGFLTTTVTETQAIQAVEFLETGTQLIFRPFIGNDGYIRMELHPEDSVGFVNAQGLPSEQTTEVTTNILIRDGETILIGGLFREVTTDARKQVPFLGGLPIVGDLFRSRSDSTAREEIIILLTVHIVKDQAAYASASEEEYQRIDRMRVGARQGLMWHGRERVAQGHYYKAMKSHASGDAEKALWHANMALHNHPRMVPAALLKEKILRQREWDEDASGQRSFLHQLIAKERGYTGGLLGRPARSIPATLLDEDDVNSTDTEP